jgi:hypothetical protein
MAKQQFKIAGLEPSDTSLPDLARRVSKAIERGKGLRLSAADLILVAAFGINNFLQAIAAKQLKEKALCRDVRDAEACIGAVTIGLTGTVARMDRFDRHSSPSSGMTESADASALLARAQKALSPRRKR